MTLPGLLAFCARQNEDIQKKNPSLSYVSHIYKKFLKVLAFYHSHTENEIESRDKKFIIVNHLYKKNLLARDFGPSGQTKLVLIL